MCDPFHIDVPLVQTPLPSEALRPTVPSARSKQSGRAPRLQTSLYLATLPNPTLRPQPYPTLTGKAPPTFLCIPADFDVLETLGAGSFATVFKARPRRGPAATVVLKETKNLSANAVTKVRERRRGTLRLD